MLVIYSEIVSNFKCFNDILKNILQNRVQKYILILLLNKLFSLFLNRNTFFYIIN